MKPLPYKMPPRPGKPSLMAPTLTGLAWQANAPDRGAGRAKARMARTG